jgi:beta-lactamase regulating signal transducer with metallopeptidase domain
MIIELFDALVKINIAAAAGVIVVLLVRRPLRRIAGPSASYPLWLIVPITAAASLLPLRKVTAQLPEAPFWEVMPETVQLLAKAKATLHPEPFMAGAAAWIVGALLGLVVCAVAQARGLRRLGVLKPVAGEARTLIASTAGFGPVVIGAFFPRIVAPADFESRFAPEEQAVILAHEKVHLRRGDALINGFAVLCQCLFWFNPLIHVAAYFMRQDQELACDAAVMARHPGARRIYAEAMLKTQLADSPLPLGCYWPARGEHPLKQRIAMLKAPPAGRRRRAIGIVCAAALACSAGFVAWAVQPPTVQGPKLVAGDPRLDNTGFVNLFDGRSPVMIRGVVTGAEWVEPRAFFYIVDEKGKTWAAMGGSPDKADAEMRARLSPGMPVVVKGYHAWDKSCDRGCVVYLYSVTRPDGELLLGQ